MRYGLLLWAEVRWLLSAASCGHSSGYLALPKGKNAQSLAETLQSSGCGTSASKEQRRVRGELGDGTDSDLLLPVFCCRNLIGINGDYRA